MSDTPNPARSEPKRRLVTSALPYANGPLHLGHLAGAYLPADVYVRYLRSAGKDVVWVCGSDEHGAAISMRAKKEGRTEQEIIDFYHDQHKEAFDRFDISFDLFHRTSSEIHHETSRELFAKLIEEGNQFQERTSEQYFDPEAGMFLADRFIQGTCPNCAYPDAFGDQCENCGKDLSPKELIEPRSTLSGATPTLRETKHWYFRLDEHNEWLKEYIERGRLSTADEENSHHDASTWRNHVVGQCMSWLNEGLQPRAFTRDLDWGIQVPAVPGHITEEEAAGKVLYVWFDAPIGYVSATKQWAIDQGKPELWETYWKDSSTELIHFIGKDNIVFHCLTFQATLKALGDFNVASYVPANQFLNFEGEKFSKSRGIGITMDEYLEEFRDFPNHVDAMRWALLRGAPENGDADFTWDGFVKFYDKDLADKLGNYINRVLVLTHKYFQGEVPQLGSDDVAPSAAMRHISQTASESGKLLARCEFKAAAEAAIAFVDVSNEKLQSQAPWQTYKSNPESPLVAESLLEAVQRAGFMSVLFGPLLPQTASRIASLFAVNSLTWSEAVEKAEAFEPLVAVGTQLAQPEILFPKIHDRKDDSRLRLIERQKAKLAAAPAAETDEPSPTNYPPVKDTIQYEDFAKLDLRTGTIAAAEAIPKADKLLKLTVDLGFERRTVVSGIAQHFSPEALPGKHVLLLVNLAPRKLRGVESEGMILMAEGPDGKLQFVGPEGELPAGMPVS